MKKILTSMVVACSLGFASAQTCTPDLTITEPGMYPDTYTNLPYAYVGIPYSTSVQFKVLTDTTISGTHVTITNITLDSVSGMPSGFSFSSNPANHVFPGGSNACASLYGSPQLGQEGTYHLVVHVMVHGIAFGFIPVSQPQTVTGYKIIISAPPVVYFSGTPTAICQGDEVVFDDNSAGHPTSWTWSFPGGSPSSSNLQVPPPIVYTTSGSKNVTLTVSSPAGTDTKTKNAYITVNNSSIAATISPAGNISICPGDNVTLSANTGSGLTYQWMKNAVDISGATSSTYVAIATGNYSVREGNSGGCSNTSVETHVSVSNILASITAGSSTTFCDGESVLLTANAGTGLSYQWKKDGVNISGETNISFNATDAGMYKVTVINSIGCSAISAGITTTVNNLPSATISANGPVTFCKGKNVTLSANTGSGLSYQWSSVYVPIPGATGSSYIASSRGWFRVTVTNSLGCSRVSNMIHVYVNSIPSPVVNVSGPLTFCDGGSVNLSSANSGAGVTYQWAKHNVNIPGQTNNSYNVTKSGTYRVIVTNANGCTRSSYQTVISVNSLPAASVSANGPLTFCQGQSVNLTASFGIGYTYQWTKHDVNIPGETGMSYLAKKTGNYKVVVTNLDGCVKTSGPKNVLVNCREENGTGIIAGETDAFIYPNPTSSITAIHLNLVNAGIVSIKVFDITGKLMDTVADGNFEEGNHQFTFDASVLTKGIYFTSISTPDGIKTIKLVVNKD